MDKNDRNFRACFPNYSSSAPDDDDHAYNEKVNYITARFIDTHILIKGGHRNTKIMQDVFLNKQELKINAKNNFLIRKLICLIFHIKF